MIALVNKIGDLLVKALLFVPSWGVKVLAGMIFLALAILPFLLPKDYIFKGAPNQKLWRDIRFWTLAVVLVELAIYLYF